MGTLHNNGIHKQCETLGTEYSRSHEELFIKEIEEIMDSIKDKKPFLVNTKMRYAIKLQNIENIKRSIVLDAIQIDILKKDVKRKIKLIKKKRNDKPNKKGK